ncbi:Uu.00g029830.m01.CDS01 [Anthostomella pinea]|uniref:Uu.00g029830.m01.CDS01 n=1 Tax=Anthostomella pinea TaxID=933095 RepID=A0AAI8YCW2_9PEZI|nr:Uu.00g029830.m01.CDS01 [Anthostomella pinea]
MDLQALPSDVFTLIVDHLVATIGIYKAVRLRLVNRMFDTAVLSAICNSHVVDIDDPATPHLHLQMPPELKARILLSRSRSATKNKVVHVIQIVNQELNLVAEPDDDHQCGPSLLIAEAAAHKYPGKPRQIRGDIKDIDAKMEAQNRLSGLIVLGDLPRAMALLQDASPALADVNAESPYFGRPLQIAAAWGDADIVRSLLDHGADPQAGSYTEDDIWYPQANVGVQLAFQERSAAGSALSAAARGGHEDITRLLLAARREGLSPLGKEFARAVLAATIGGHTHLINLLLQNAASSLSDCPKLREEMLWAAATSSQRDVVKLVLDDGADVNAAPYPDSRGYGCALSIASRKGNIAMVRLLLSYGADVNFKHTRESQDPIKVAALNGHQEVVQLLLEQGASMVSALRQAADGGQAHLVRWLLQKDPDLVHEAYSYELSVGQEALRCAILIKNPTVISLLVRAGAPLNRGYASRGDSPVVWAKTNAAEWIVDFLLSLGAEDREVDEKERNRYRWDEREPQFQMLRGGVRIVRRTWQWVGKY